MSNSSTRLPTVRENQSYKHNFKTIVCKKKTKKTNMKAIAKAVVSPFCVTA